MGTIINFFAIIVASILGVLFKKGLPEKIQKAIMFALGIGLSVLAIGWFLKDFLVIEDNKLLTQGDLLIIVSLVIGSLFGEWIDIDDKLNRFAHHIERKYKLPPLAKGFVSGTLIFCVGAMAILGSIQDGLTGDYTILVVKSALDFVTAMLLAAVLGIGVLFSAFSVLIYQGSITLLAMAIGDFFTDEIIRSISMVGNILLVGIGLNFMEIKKVKVANMLPALLIPIIYFVILSIL
ncbi:MAG: DUF554 domain-containing protein [Candidatus Izemoplasmataceae bacterium]|jgi:uncharacterized protein|uniref:DUF554 domain-containing protein n=1 Tax=Liberiplasma polymorphum TaxID=3374570 RepID=UPI0037729A3B